MNDQKTVLDDSLTITEYLPREVQGDHLANQLDYMRTTLFRNLAGRISTGVPYEITLGAVTSAPLPTDATLMGYTQRLQITENVANG